jgi:hypothetical protein
MLKGLMGAAKDAIGKVQEASRAFDELRERNFLSSFNDFISVEDGVICSVSESTLVAKAKIKWVFSDISRSDAISGQVRSQRLRCSVLTLFFDGRDQSPEEGVYHDNGDPYLLGILYRTARNKYFVVLEYRDCRRHARQRAAFVFEDESELKSWAAQNVSISDYRRLFDD